MNRGEWKTEVLKIVGRQDDSDLSDRLNLYANIINKQIARGYAWPELYELDTTTMSTTADEPLVALPESTRTILSLRLIDGTQKSKLIQTTARRADAYTYATNTGKPRLYIPYRTQIELLPVPNDTYSIYIRRFFWPSNMTADDTEFPWDDKDDLVLQLGVMWAYMLMQEETEAKIWAGYASGSFKEARLKAEETVDWDRAFKPVDFASNSGVLPDDYWLNPMIG